MDSVPSEVGEGQVEGARQYGVEGGDGVAVAGDVDVAWRGGDGDGAGVVGAFGQCCLVELQDVGGDGVAADV